MRKLTKFIINTEILSAFMLFGSVILALTISNNTFLMSYYENFINQKIYFGFGNYQISKTVLKWVNDGLMAIFFFLLGLEMKYHITEGEFQDKRNLILPFFGAIGGFALPAILYYIVNINYPEGQRGWAIPVATDTAFVLAIISFFGQKISSNAKIFLIGLSIIDDVLAVIILAVFYTPNLDEFQLLLCIFPIIGLALINYFNYSKKWFYWLLGLLLWLFTVKSGVHGTIAGIILAFFIPLKVKTEKDTINLLKEMEKSVHSFVAFVVLPIFAFVNCELSFSSLSMSDLSSKIAIGCFIGLLFGKSIGIYLSSIIAVKSGMCKLPEATNSTTFLGISILCGIGFTLSLFIGLQAFDSIDFEKQMKLGVLAGSFLCAIIGYLVIRVGVSNSNFQIK